MSLPDLVAMVLSRWGSTNTSADSFDVGSDCLCKPAIASVDGQSFAIAWASSTGLHLQFSHLDGMTTSPQRSVLLSGSEGGSADVPAPTIALAAGAPGTGYLLVWEAPDADDRLALHGSFVGLSGEVSETALLSGEHMSGEHMSGEHSRNHQAAIVGPTGASLDQPNGFTLAWVATDGDASGASEGHGRVLIQQAAVHEGAISVPTKPLLVSDQAGRSPSLAVLDSQDIAITFIDPDGRLQLHVVDPRVDAGDTGARLLSSQLAHVPNGHAAKVAPLVDGSFVVVWAEHTSIGFGTGTGIVAVALNGQVFSPNADRQWSAGDISALEILPSNFQGQFDLKGLLDTPGFVLTYEYNDDLAIHRFDQNCKPLSEIGFVTSANDGVQDQVAVASLANGNIIAVYRDQSDDNCLIKTQVIDPTMSNDNPPIQDTDLQVVTSGPWPAFLDNETEVAASDGSDGQTLAASNDAVVWRTESADGGDNAIRMQVLDVGGPLSSFSPQSFTVSDGQGYEYNPVIATGLGASGWSVAWQESPAKGAPSQVKFTFVGRLGVTTSELTVHNEGSNVHQHDIALAGYVAVDPRNPEAIESDGVNVVWVSTDLTSGATVSSAEGRIMLQRFEVPLTALHDPLAPRASGLNARADYVGQSAANDNAPVQLGFGRNPSITVLRDGAIAVTWIDTSGQLQGKFIIDEFTQLNDSAPTTIVKDLAEIGLEPRGNIKYAAIGAVAGTLVVVQLIEQVNAISQLLQLAIYGQVLHPTSSSDQTASEPAQLLEVLPEGFEGDIRVEVPEVDGQEITLTWSQTTENGSEQVNHSYNISTPHDGGPSFQRVDTSQSDSPLAPTAVNDFVPAEESVELLDQGNDQGLTSDLSWPLDSAIENDLGSESPAIISQSNLDAPQLWTMTSGASLMQLFGPGVSNADVASNGTDTVIVAVKTLENGQTIIVGIPVDELGRQGPPIELSDGVVDNPTVFADDLVATVVWEEKESSSEKNADLEARLWSLAAPDDENGSGPGAMGQEFSVHKATADTHEHSAVVASYEIEGGDNDAGEVGIHVVFVATNTNETLADPAFGQVKVARFEIPVDFVSDMTLPPVGVTPQGERVNLAASSEDEEDAHIIVVAESGRDPSAAGLNDGELVVTWVNEDGQLQGTLLCPTTEPATNRDGEPVSKTTFEPAALDLSNVSGDTHVADNQTQQVTALRNGGFVVFWVTENDRDYDIVGRIYALENGVWTPSDIQVYINDVNTSHSGERIKFEVSLSNDKDSEFVVIYESNNDRDQRDGGFSASQFDEIGDAVGGTVEIRGMDDNDQLSVGAFVDGRLIVVTHDDNASLNALDDAVVAQIYDLRAPGATITGTDDQDKLAGTIGDDVIDGGGDKDELFGSDGDDRLMGGDAEDVLLGGSGADNLNGGSGKDRLDGGTGDDTLFGGFGNDTFVFNAGSGNDVITDFGNTAGDDDTLHVSGLQNFEALQQAMQQVNGDVVISIGSDTLTVQNVNRANLDEKDFWFG